MSRARPLIGGLAGFGSVDVPRTTLKLKQIRKTLERHKLADDLQPAIIDTLQAAADDYLLSKQLEQQGALVSEIHKYIGRIAGVETELQSIFHAKEPEAAAADRVIWQRVMADGGPDRERMLGMIGDLAAYRTAALKFASTLGPIKPQSPKVAAHKRRVQLAKAMLNWFYDAGLPTETTASGLMAELLADVLESVGEPHTKPQDLLHEAQWPEAMLRPRRKAGRKPKAK